MLSLAEVSSDPTKRPALVAAITELIDQEVAARSGLTGMAVKGGYKVVKQLKGGQMVPDLVEGLLDEFVGALEPLHAEHRGRGGGGFAAFLRSNEQRAIQALLGVTDRRAKRTSHALLRSTYERLRPMAEKPVGEALPGVGRVVDRFCA